MRTKYTSLVRNEKLEHYSNSTQQILQRFYTYRIVKSCYHSLGSLPPEQDVDLLLDPVLVVGGVGVGGPLVDKAGKIGQLINEVKQLRYIVRYRRDVGVLPFQMLLVNLEFYINLNILLSRPLNEKLIIKLFI